MTYDFSTPEQRSTLAESLGAEKYNEEIEKWFTATSVSVINGYRIRPVMTRFGRLFSVDGSNTAFQTLDQACKHACLLPVGKVVR